MEVKSWRLVWERVIGEVSIELSDCQMTRLYWRNVRDGEHKSLVFGQERRKSV